MQRAAAAYAGFLQVVRADVALTGCNMIAASVCRILIHPSIQSNNQHVWANITVGLSMLTTAAALSSYSLLWLQTSLRTSVVSVVAYVSPSGDARAASRGREPSTANEATGARHLSEAALSQIDVQLKDVKTYDVAEWLEGVAKANQTSPADLELGAVIGRGGYGLVVEARRKSSEQRVAVKVLDPALLKTKSSVRRLGREVQVGSRISTSRHLPTRPHPIP